MFFARGRVTLQSRVAPGKFSVAWGRAVRAGSIGRDGQRLGERDEYPPEGREASAPAPSTEKSAPCDSKRIVRTPRPGFRFALPPGLNPLRPATRD